MANLTLLMMAGSVFAISGSEQRAEPAHRGKTVSEWIVRLEHKDPGVRLAAAATLGEMGVDAKPAVPALTKALAGEDVILREFAATALGGIGPNAKPAVPALLDALEDPLLSKEAAEALGKILPNAVKALVENNRPKPDPGAITEIAFNNVQLQGQVVRVWNVQNNRIALNLRQAGFVNLANGVVAPANRESQVIRWKVAKSKSDAVGQLMGVLASHDAAIRQAGAKALGDQGKNAAAAVPALIRALADTNANVRSAAAAALGNIGQPSVPALSQALRSDARLVKAAAAATLGNLGSDAAPAVGALIDALDDEDPQTRKAAAKALAQIGPHATSALIAKLRSE